MVSRISMREKVGPEATERWEAALLQSFLIRSGLLMPSFYLLTTWRGHKVQTLVVQFATRPPRERGIDATREVFGIAQRQTAIAEVGCL